MGKQFDQLSEAHRRFIARQAVFFVATAAPEARINLSPKDAASLRVLSPHAVAYRDLTGSGNETAAHLAADGRMTLMFCAFEAAPLILRLYGRGEVMPLGTPAGAALLESAFGGDAPVGIRQLVRLDVEFVQTSCGFGVPLFDYRGERDNLRRWAADKGPEGLAAYRSERNVRSLDGLPSGWREADEFDTRD